MKYDDSLSKKRIDLREEFIKSITKVEYDIDDKVIVFPECTITTK